MAGGSSGGHPATSLKDRLTHDRFRSLFEAGMALTSELSLDAVLQRLVEAAAELTAARYAALGVIDSSGSRLDRFVVHGIDRETQEAIGERPRGRGILGAVLQEVKPLRLHDLSEDPRSVGFPPGHPPMRTFLGVPIRVRGVAYGNLYLAEKEEGRDFTDEDEEIVTLLAAQASVAIDLSDRVARESLRRVVAAQEVERRRLARELHDETGQALTSILLGLRSLEELVDGDDERAAVAVIRQLAVETLQDVRRLAVELRPKALDDFGLVAALERIADTFGEQTGLEVDFATPLGDDQLPGEVATALYRIAQEALTNVVKHSHAGAVSILLTRKNGRVALVVEDDGIGFDPARPVDGFGLQGMRERVELLGGSLHVESRTGAGTTLAVEVPL
jgi:signal transduction histidine kinase